MSIPLRQLLVMVALLAAGVWSVATIHLQTELFPIFPQDLPSVRGLAEAERLFASEREVIVVIRGKPGVSDLKLKASIGRIHDGLRRLPEVESVVDLSAGLPVPPENAAAWLIATMPPAQFQKFQSLFSVAQMRSRLAETKESFAGALDEETLARLRFDPLRLAVFLEETTGQKFPSIMAPPRKKNPLSSLLVRSRDPLGNFESCQKFVARVRGAIAGDAELQSDAEILLTGRPAFVAETSTQMKRDMHRMIVLAVILVCLVFWIVYRSVLPLLWIVLLQGLAMLSGVIAARVIFGELNVLSMGFASIILGVGMDYCILVYHHHIHADHEMWPTLRRSIWLSAITTAASFAILYFSSFPGFKQLALLVAAGLLTTAWLATAVLPGLLKGSHPPVPAWIERASDQAAAALQRNRWRIRWGFIFACAVLLSLWPFWRNYPFYDADLNRLQPTGSEAYRGQKMLSEVQGNADPAMLMLSGKSWPRVREQAVRLGKAKSLDVSTSLLWIPVDGMLESNRASWTSGKIAAVDQAFGQAGFGGEWSQFTKKVLQELDLWKAGGENFSDIQSFAQNFTGSAHGIHYLLLRLPDTACALNGSPAEFWKKILQEAPGSLPVSWELLKSELSEVAQHDFQRLSVWMLLLIFVLCTLIHRSARLVAFNFFALASALLILLALLRLTNTSMSLLSLLAVPLLIGLVVDYSLHLLLVLEEHGGDLQVMYRHLAVPVCLTGLTSMIGFGSPMITRQPALQNFGFVMDLGVFSAVVAGLLLLPAFYFRGSEKLPYSRMLYRAFLLELASRICARIGLVAARKVGRALGALYAWTHPGTAAIVRKNLSLLSKDPIPSASARRVFASYGATMADYLTLGTCSKQKATELMYEKDGIQHLERVNREGNGCLIVTAHFGLFELGGLLLTNVGFPTTILTLPEPSRDLTDWRARYRKRWEINTLEVGEEDFSFLKIVRELGQGKFVAALADRPYQRSYVPVDFPNGKIPFSSGPVLIALLARCPIVPGAIIVLPSGGYRMQAYPPLYPHLHKGSREETLRFFTQEIARALLPALCQYPEQWYQFGPVSC